MFVYVFPPRFLIEEQDVFHLWPSQEIYSFQWETGISLLSVCRNARENIELSRIKTYKESLNELPLNAFIR